MSLEEIIQLLKACEANRFFGRIELAYHDGACITVYRNETLKGAAFKQKPTGENRGYGNGNTR